MRHVATAAIVSLASRYVLGADLTLAIGSQGDLSTGAEHEGTSLLRRDETADLLVPLKDVAAVEMKAFSHDAKKDEPYVSCGMTTASVCSACPQGHGLSWCGGDCHWQVDTGQCLSRSHHGYVQDITPPPTSNAAPSAGKGSHAGEDYPEQAGTTSGHGNSDTNGNITTPVIDKNAQEIRHKQERFEAESAQRKKDEEQFIQTVIISAVVSGAVVVSVFLCGWAMTRETKTVS
jgi:hypothetical protein